MSQSIKNRKNFIRFTSIVFLLLLTGCWSSHEIEELGFAVGLAIDKGKETKIEKEIEKKAEDIRKRI